ncbi:MAG: hypothetical protein DMG72_17865 [Acidobacteria bacterium]|nr:MAG: hypothetical protein DMG72_17865 [Acidobacteriota bacterium]
MTTTAYQYQFKGFGDAELISDGRENQFSQPGCTRITPDKLTDRFNLSPETKDLLGQVALYGGSVLAARARSLLETAAPLQDILGDMLWQLGYIQDANGWAVNVQSRAQADNIAQEILRQNPNGSLCSFVAAIKARRAVRIPGKSCQETEAAIAMGAYQAREAWAARAVLAVDSGQPPPPPPVPPSPKELDFGDGLTSRHLEALVDLIVSAPEAERASLLLDTVTLLAGWLLRKGQAVGPDGRIIVGVKTPDEAGKIVAGWINDEVARQKIEADEAEAPVSSQQPEDEGSGSAVSDIEEPPQDVIIAEEGVPEIKAAQTAPSERPSQESKPGQTIETASAHCSVREQKVRQSSNGKQCALTYRSKLKNAIAHCLRQQPHASNRDICNWLDEKWETDLPPEWDKKRNRSFASAYEDPAIRAKIDPRISEVRADMRKRELL